MSFTLSAIVLFGILLAMLIRSRAVGIWSAAIAALFGFYLARTPAATSVDALMTAVSGMVPAL
ncbi:hypothetical protein ACH41E_09175 [Streptomyces sp. NPDC020412]|uniref:hypothetical protein n=1 Tax=Streptomyces sp. NPDC020412 TaxID=3365073 RepID=UPI0037B48EA3